MAKKDPLLTYTCNVVNLSDFDNSEIRQAVLPRIESDYDYPPDLQTCKAFLVSAAKGKYGRIEALPTVETI
ncbi:Zinc finger C2H2 [Penicillium hordei]|uniref:Zinc finger C2H2 n=1 Tax=Penicillium hordei TaxID=40994 RepID=A0AAD6H1V6_9EURO|nr:Zinc finger C2H2 [Penicillium hordei]KAJ5598578.1 Zinc finger C2H2 [Penicillium hordei]